MQTKYEQYRKMASIAQIGWWQADFSAGYYVCSDFLCDLLDIKEDTIPFYTFRNFIREDFREQVVQEFSANISINRDFYEKTFPIISPKYGEVWLQTRLAAREKGNGTNGGDTSFGTIQRVEAPTNEKEKHILYRFNNLMQRQNSISKSLLHFLQDTEIEQCITEVLEDVLKLYNDGRVYIFEYDKTHSVSNCTYEVVSKGVPAEIDKLQTMPTETLRWWNGQILSGKPIILDSLIQLPDEATLEFNILNQQDIKSMMVIPLINGKQIWGYMGIDLVSYYHTWTNEDYQWFSSLANIINICIELRKAKDNVVRDQSFLSNLFKYMPLGYIHMSIVRDDKGKPCDYRITDANEICAKFFEVTREDMTGLLASEIYHGSPKGLDDIITLSENSTYREQDEYFPKSGRYTHWVTYSPEKDEVVGLFIDITDTVKANRALDRSDKMFKNIFANIPAGVEIYDKDGILTDINNKDMEIFGIRHKNDAIGIKLFENPNLPQNIRDRIRNEDLVDFRINYSFNRIEKYYATERVNSIELYTKVSKLYDNTGEFIGYIFISIDNTERIDAMTRIRDFENFFLLISDYAKVGYAKINLLNRKGYAIKQWLKNMGETEDIPLEEVVGVYDKIHPEDRIKILDFYENVKKGTGKTFRDEVRVLRPGSKDKWNWVRMNVVVTKYEPENNEIEIIGINYDITELKETEAELIKARDKAETMDRLKSAFLANMSHEIRTPLNAIVGFSDLLVETTHIEERKEYIKIVHENTELLLQLISDILDLSKIEAGTFDFTNNAVDINSLCEDIIRSTKLKMPDDVELIFEHHLPEYYIISDRNRLHQVLINLVNNAIKFTSKGKICIGYEKKGNKLEFYVSDTGIGIDKEQLPNIFERFVKLNSFVRGTGLGLSICKSIIEQLGGNIGVDSELGKGSRFWFTIPDTITTSTAMEDSPAMENIPNGRNQNKKEKPAILVAEDTDSNYLLIATLLRKNYTVEWAHNGIEAVEMCKHLKPDLILMDMRMPQMDGLEATKAIREFDKETPILALTAFAFENDREKAIKAGCNGFITKPITAATIIDDIQETLNKRQTAY